MRSSGKARYRSYFECHLYLCICTFFRDTEKVLIWARTSHLFIKSPLTYTGSDIKTPNVSTCICGLAHPGPRPSGIPSFRSITTISHEITDAAA